MSIAVVVQKSAPGPPAPFALRQTRLCVLHPKMCRSRCYEKGCCAPRTCRRCRPIRRCRSRQRIRQSASHFARSRFLRHIGKRSVAIVLVEMSGRRFSRGPIRSKPVPIRKVDVQPTIVVIVKESSPASLGLDDDPLMIDPAPHVGHCQARMFSHIDELNRRGRGTRHCSSHVERLPHFHSGVVSVSSNVLPATKTDDPTKRRRGIFIELQEVRDGDFVAKTFARQQILMLITFASSAMYFRKWMRGTIPTPSLTAILESTGTFVSLSTCPLGHVITSDSILNFFPNRSECADRWRTYSLCRPLPGPHALSPPR